MRDEPVSFNSVNETAWSLGLPFFEDGRCRKLVKSVVYFHRLEDKRVFLKPKVRRDIFWIEKSLPMAVIPSGAPDMNFSVLSLSSHIRRLPSLKDACKYCNVYLQVSAIFQEVLSLFQDRSF